MLRHDDGGFGRRFHVFGYDRFCGFSDLKRSQANSRSWAIWTFCRPASEGLLDFCERRLFALHGH
jgi:hypothetical protein